MNFTIRYPLPQNRPERYKERFVRGGNCLYRNGAPLGVPASSPPQVAEPSGSNDWRRGGGESAVGEHMPALDSRVAHENRQSASVNQTWHTGCVGTAGFYSFSIEFLINLSKF